MNCCRETAKMGVPPGNRPAAPRDWFRGVPERYVAGSDTRGRLEGRPYPWSQQVIHEISGLAHISYPTLAIRDKAIFFALAALRSVPQAGSQFRGLATAIHEISGLLMTL